MLWSVGGIVGVSVLALEVASELPFCGFVIEGMFDTGPDGNAAKDEETA